MSFSLPLAQTDDWNHQSDQGTAVKLDAAAFVENGRTYLPLRFVSETLGAQVVWNEAEKTVTITK